MPSNYRNRSRKKPVKPKPPRGLESVKSYPAEGKHPTGREWERIKASVLEFHHRVCHLCGHPGAEQVDHIIPFTERADLATDPKNLRPAHGSSGTQSNPCATCNLNCNNIRGMGSVARAKRIIAKRQGKAEEEGREW